MNNTYGALFYLLPTSHGPLTGLLEHADTMGLKTDVIYSSDEAPTVVVSLGHYDRSDARRVIRRLFTLWDVVRAVEVENGMCTELRWGLHDTPLGHWAPVERAEAADFHDGLFFFTTQKLGA